MTQPQRCSTASTAPRTLSGTVVDVTRNTSGFLDFLKDTLLPASDTSGPSSLKDDQYLIALLKQAPVPSAELINDLSGVASGHLQTQSPFVAAASSAELPPTQQADQHQADQQQSQLRHHRAVITSMAPALTRAASAKADDDDTASVVTLPMPNRKRRRSEEEDEACSSPNDLVEMPAAAAAAPPAKQQRTSGGRPVAQAAAAAAAQQDARMGAAARDQAAAAAAGGGSGTAAAASAAATASAAPAAAAARGIVVSKVLTKSDATSKRIILPRIAVETNLPQLESSPAFHFSALDPAGAPWPLVIKAWANGSNPRPVFVLEQVGEVMKANRLGVGDAVALLADEDGGFFLEWNTPRATAAAARPTASGIVFKHLKKQQGGSGSNSGAGGGGAAPAAAAGKPPKAAAARADKQEAAAAAPAPVQEQQQQPKAAPAAAAAPKLQLQAAPSFPLPEVEAGPQALPQHMMQQRAGSSEAAAGAAAPVSAAAAAPDGGPYMTAVPVTSPQVPGTFIPSSPCQLLVMGHMPMPDLELDLERSRPQPALTPALLGSDDAPDGSADAAAGGSVLQCPRTAGCTRPAGHQGWCLGHKGYKKRRP